MSLPETRRTLQRIATHVVARRRFQMTGRFGLRAAPGGLATPAFGDDVEVVRISGEVLVREVGGTATAVELAGSTLRRLARVAGADLDAGFSAGDDSPDVGDPDAAVEVDGGEVAELGDWWCLGARVLDAVVAELPGGRGSTVQLWPEHFDAAATVTLGNGAKANVGFSAGDAGIDQPYLYVGPWDADRPGDAGYWNAPFGATLGRDDVLASADPAGRSADFVRTGLGFLG